MEWTRPIRYSGVADEITGGFHLELRGLEPVFRHFAAEHLCGQLRRLFKVKRRFAGFVGDAEAAAEIDELEVDLELLAGFSDDVHEETRYEREIFRVRDAGTRHHVCAETLDARLFRELVGFHDLVRMNSEFGVGTGVRDEFADIALAVTGIDAERKDFRLAELEQARQEGDVVEVEDDPAFQSLPDVVVGQEVAAEHHVFAAEPDMFCEQDFIDAGCIDAGAFLAQNIDDRRIVAGLDGIEHFEVGIMFCERIESAPVIFPDLLLVVNISGGSELCRDIRCRNLADGYLVTDEFHCESPCFIFLHAVICHNLLILSTSGLLKMAFQGIFLSKKCRFSRKERF